MPYPTCTSPTKSIWLNFLTFWTEVGSGSSGAWDAGNGINAEEPKDVRFEQPIPFWLGYKFCVVDNKCSLGFANWSGVNKDGGVGKGPEVESTNEGAECRGWIGLGSGQMSWKGEENWGTFDSSIVMDAEYGTGILVDKRDGTSRESEFFKEVRECEWVRLTREEVVAEDTGRPDSEKPVHPPFVGNWVSAFFIWFCIATDAVIDGE